MKYLYKVSSLVMLFASMISAQDLYIQRVQNPDLAMYQPMFAQFYSEACFAEYTQEAMDQLTTAAIEQEAVAYANNPKDMIFLQAIFMNEIIGFLSCQVVAKNQVHVHLLAVNPEKYDEELIKELLFAIFELVPQIQRLSVRFPALCFDMIFLLEDLGFVRHDKEESIPSLVTYNLMVHPKCKICEILYGPDFWEQEVDPEDGQWGGWSLQESEKQKNDPETDGMCPLEEASEENGICPLE